MRNIRRPSPDCAQNVEAGNGGGYLAPEQND